MILKFNYYDSRKTNTAIISTENKFSSASIGASFTPQGLSNISVNANKGNGNSKETYTSYSPALIRAEENAVITSGKDTDILGSKVQGDKVTARVGGNLNIETLQEKENYEEQNKSAGFGVSWSMNPVTQRLSKPTFSRDLSKGTIDSLYRSARDQAGFFAGSKAFDIYVKKNTDLKGGLIASEASSDKNKLSTGTFSFSDLHNEAEYRAKDTGSSSQIKPTLVQTKKEDPEGNKEKTLKIVQALHSTPSIPTVVQGSADSTTKAAVAPGIIDIRENPTQDISALSRDTENALNELGRIFDKKSVEEQKELVNVFREEAFRLLHDLPDDGSGRKVLIHSIIGGLISQFAGVGFASGAAGAGLNEALINNLKGLDPTLAQLISGAIGAAAAKIVNGDATAGAISAASGTKWNYFLMSRPNEFGINNLAKNILKKKDGQELSEEEADQLLRGMNSILSAIDPDLGNAKDPFAEDINTYQYAIRYLEYRGITKESGMQFFTAYNEVVRKRDWNGVYKQPGTIYVDADSKTETMVDVPRRPPIGVYHPTITEPYQEGKIIGGEASSDQSKAAFGKTVGIETFKAEADRPVTLYNKYHDNPVKALKIGIFAPLGLGYDIYQDYGKYSGTDLTKVTLVNGGAFVATSIADAWLIGSAGMSVEATIPANIVIVEFANELKKSLAKTDEEKQRENP